MPDTEPLSESHRYRIKNQSVPRRVKNQFAGLRALVRVVNGSGYHNPLLSHRRNMKKNRDIPGVNTGVKVKKLFL